MGISLKPQHLNRYRQIAWIFMKYGRSDLVKTTGLSEALEAEQRVAPAEAAKANELAGDLEKLGPTFVKLGQLLSTRVELLPAAYLEALARLQDKVEPFSFAEVEKIVSAELGVRMSKAFSEFDDQPMAAASLGQVHRATLRDGRPVAVKVQRPAIREQMVEDLDALEEIAEFLDNHTELGKRYEFGQMLEQFRKSLLQELDYRQEATNLTTIGEELRHFEHIIIPAPIADYCTSRVLTMEFVPGKKITDLSPLARMDFDGAALAEELFRAYLEQILVSGFFHADPHPGNVFITADYRIALLDLGMVGRIMPRLQEDLLQLLARHFRRPRRRGGQYRDQDRREKRRLRQQGVYPPHLRNRRPTKDRDGRANAGGAPRPRSDAKLRRERDSRSARADDARQNAAQSRSGGSRYRAGVRPERLHPPQCRANPPAAPDEKPLAREPV